MKTTLKLAAILLLAATTMFAVSCGGNNTKKPDTEQPGGDGGGDDKDDNGTVAGRLAKGGLTLDAILPDTRFAEAAIPGYDPDKTEVCLYLEGEENPTAEWKETYFTKLMAAIASASDDGKVYESYIFGDPVELSLADVNWEAWILIFQPSYKHNGEWITLTTAPVPAERDGFTHAISLKFIY
jgi:hypothetical protein